MHCNCHTGLGQLCTQHLDAVLSCVTQNLLYINAIVLDFELCTSITPCLCHTAPKICTPWQGGQWNGSYLFWENFKMIREKLCYFLSIRSLSKNKVVFLYIISECAMMQTQTWLIILADQTLLTYPHPLPSMTLRHAAGKVVPLVFHSMEPIPLCPLNCYLPTPGLRSQSTSPYSSAQRNERQTKA